MGTEGENCEQVWAGGLQGGKVWVLVGKTISRCEEGATGWESVGTAGGKLSAGVRWGLQGGKVWVLEGKNCQQV